jgi:hypothetical protein
MKTKEIVCALFALSSIAGATTVTAGGGTGGAQFYTSAGTILTSSNSTIRVGRFVADVFTPFGLSDPTPIAISTVAALAGRWSAGYTDNSATATDFNGAQIWFQVTTTADNGGTATFSGGQFFPNNAGGAADATTISSVTLTTLGAGSTAGSRAYEVGDGRIIIGVTAIPEPSTMLLGALGALGLLRRRR